MNKRKVAIYIIYTIILILVFVIGYFVIRKTSVETDNEAPIIKATVNGSSVIIEASDDVGVYAYAYSDENRTPSNWYEANNKKEFTETLRIVRSGDYYVWAKDEFGNISEVANFSLACEYGNFVGIEEKVYCPYSTMKAFGYNWHILDDSDGYLTLFMDSGELKKLSHCSDKESSTFCYYASDDNKKAYSWGNSMIGYYLNNDFKDSLGEIELKEASVCNDESGVKGCVDNDGCGGYLASDVNQLNNFCESQYIASPVRLLSFMEYNRILIDLKGSDASWVYGTEKYWTMNAWRKEEFAASIDSDGIYTVDEKTTAALDVRPVIVVKR